MNNMHGELTEALTSSQDINYTITGRFLWDNGKIAGWVGWTIKRNLIRGEPYVYLAEIMVDPHFRRKGIATRLVKEVEKNAKEIGSSYVYCYIFEPNDASKALFRKLGYSHMEDIKSHALSAYKKAGIARDFEIERINKNDIREAVSLVTLTMQGEHTSYNTLLKALNHKLAEFQRTD